MTQLPLIMQCTDKESIVRAQYCSEWTELGSILCSEMIDEDTTFIVCSYLRGVEWVHGLFLFPLVLGKM